MKSVLVRIRYIDCKKQIEKSRYLSAPLTAIQAIARSNMLNDCPHVDINQLTIAWNGRQCAATHLITEPGYIDLCQPLACDPKTRRRLKIAKQATTQ